MIDPRQSDAAPAPDAEPSELPRAPAPGPSDPVVAPDAGPSDPAVAPEAEPSDPPVAPDAEPSDDALLLRVAARDRAAFGQLFRRHAGRVKGFLMRGGVGAAEADETAQEVMLLVWRRAETFDPARAGALTWIFAIARNRRADLWRRRRPEPDPSDPHFAPDPAPGAEVAAAAADRDRALRAALDALSADQMEVVRLAFYEGMSHSEAAAALAAPLGTVKSRLRLALARLRGALGPDFASELLE